jgi:hypothetical protein
MRSRQDPKHASWLAFVDFLFNFLIAFAFLFIVAFMMIRPAAVSDTNVKAKAEFMLTMTWPDEAFDDIDMWIMLPSGKKVFYNHKEEEYALLDRDDLGAHGDTYKLDPLDADSKKGLIKQNREVITLRAIVPGRYVVAAHVFATYSEVDGFKTELPLPYEAKLEVIKINPRVTTVATSKVLLEKKAQHATFLAFTIDADGQVTNIEQNPDDDIIAVTDKYHYTPGARPSDRP